MDRIEFGPGWTRRERPAGPEELLAALPAIRHALKAHAYRPGVIAADADGRPCPAQAETVHFLSLRGAVVRAAGPGACRAWGLLRALEDWGGLPAREPRQRDSALAALDRAEAALRLADRRAG